MVQFLVAGFFFFSSLISFILFTSFRLLLECYGAGLQDVTRRICLHGADEVFLFYLCSMFYLISPLVFATVRIVVRNAIDLNPTAGTAIDCTSCRPVVVVSKHSY